METATLDLAYSMPPAGLVMPHTVELYVTSWFAVLAVATALYAGYKSLARRTWVPVLMLLGGLFTVLLEAIADPMIKVTHPAQGQMNAFVANGVPVPVYVVLAYFSYYGTMSILLYDRIMAQTIDARTWWKLTAVTAVMLVVGESLFTWLGLFVFYGRHPLWIGPMPLWFEAANTASVMLPALLLYRFVPLLKGWRQLLILFIVPVAACGAHFATGAPGYNVLGADTGDLPRWLIEVSGLATIGFGMLTIWLGIEIASGAAPERAASV